MTTPTVANNSKVRIPVEFFNPDDYTNDLVESIVLHHIEDEVYRVKRISDNQEIDCCSDFFVS